MSSTTTEILSNFVEEKDNLSEEEEFEISNVEKEDVATITNQCNYVKRLHEISKLHVLQPRKVISAYEDRKECGLFHLF